MVNFRLSGEPAVLTADLGVKGGMRGDFSAEVPESKCKTEISEMLNRAVRVLVGSRRGDRALDLFT
jgi:hypothetical protein